MPWPHWAITVGGAAAFQSDGSTATSLVPIGAGTAIPSSQAAASSPG
jgi:hypothetical protein